MVEEGGRIVAKNKCHLTAKQAIITCAAIQVSQQCRWNCLRSIRLDPFTAVRLANIHAGIHPTQLWASAWDERSGHSATFFFYLYCKAWVRCSRRSEIKGARHAKYLRHSYSGKTKRTLSSSNSSFRGISSHVRKGQRGGRSKMRASIPFLWHNWAGL